MQKYETQNNNGITIAPRNIVQGSTMADNRTLKESNNESIVQGNTMGNNSALRDFNIKDIESPKQTKNIR